MEKERQLLKRIGELQEVLTRLKESYRNEMETFLQGWSQYAMDSLMLDVEMQEEMLDHALDQSLRDLEPQSQQVEPPARAPKRKANTKKCKAQNENAQIWCKAC